MTTASPVDPLRAQASAHEFWRSQIVPALTEYVRIPNKSPAFAPDWREQGHMDAAVALAERWCRENAPPDVSVEVLRLDDRTPLLFLDVPGTRADASDDDTVLLYGHLDKQPEMTGWREGLGPWTPVIEDGRLYGRGGADDGYAVFACVAALRLLREQGVPHRRCVIVIECCEESGSYDLPAYIDALGPRLGTPSLVICLDSGCGNYDQLWVTTSLRGAVLGTLSVELLREGVHSGAASGVVASSFRVLRDLLSRVEDPQTGRILLEALHVDVPADRLSQARAAADVLRNDVADAFPFHPGTHAINNDPEELILNRTWRPALAVTGADGLPAIADAGNVMRPITSLKLSMRLPPTCRADRALEALRAALIREPPYGAHVRLHDTGGANGWNAPAMDPALNDVLDRASRAHFGSPVQAMGEGGTIPFMSMLGEQFPAAQFVVTGVLGPGSNAHGPNEFLHLATAEKLTCCVADVLAAS